MEEYYAIDEDNQAIELSKIQLVLFIAAVMRISKADALKECDNIVEEYPYAIGLDDAYHVIRRKI